MTKTHHNISLNEDYFVRFANVNEDYHVMSKTTMGTKLPRKLEDKILPYHVWRKELQPLP